MGYALAAAAAISLITSYMAYSANKEASDKQMALMQGVFDEIDRLEVPDVKKQELQVRYLRKIGALTPQLEKKILTDPSAFEGMPGVPQHLIDAQNESLAGLREIHQKGGLTAQDKFRLAQTSMKAATEERGRREAIFQNMRQRGLGGSGMELAANMMSQQAGASRRSMEGLGTEALAQERALQALKDAGQLGGQMRTQEMNEQMQKAEALDAMTRFNAQSRQVTEGRNVDRMNRADELNLADRQRIEDANTGLSNYQQQYNKELWQRDYENRMAKLGLKTGTTTQYSDMVGRQGAAEAQMYSDVGAGLNKATIAAGGYMSKNPDAEWFPGIGEGGSGGGQVASSPYDYGDWDDDYDPYYDDTRSGTLA